MWERTITVSSAGKSLCTTGWKCGWSIGPNKLLKNSRVVHKENVETYIVPIQVIQKFDLIFFDLCCLYELRLGYFILISFSFLFSFYQILMNTFQFSDVEFYFDFS